MAEEVVTTRSYGGLVLAGLVSLAVGVGGGVLVNRITERRPALEYDLIASAEFEGETQQIAIVALEISNPEDKEVERLSASMTLGEMKLREAKIVGLEPTAYKYSVKDGVFHLDAPFLNPRESFSVQLLLSSPTSDLSLPEVSVRGKGVTGVPESAASPESALDEILPASGAAFGALLSAMLIYLRRRTPKLFFTRSHRDDQRDVLAYVLGMHGFDEHAQLTRNSQRRLSYWAEADRLTESVLSEGDEERIRNAITCLQDLLDYAWILDTYRMLIHVDIARLAAAIGDNALARDYLKRARRRGHKVIEKRIDMDERLKSIRSAEDRTA